MPSNLFASSNPDQRAGILNQLLSAVGPGTGLCDRGSVRRGGRCDPDRRAGPPRRNPGDRDARVLCPAGAGQPRFVELGRGMISRLVVQSGSLSLFCKRLERFSFLPQF
jgi:hypothetical protein